MFLDDELPQALNQEILKLENHVDYLVDRIFDSSDHTRIIEEINANLRSAKLADEKDEDRIYLSEYLDTWSKAYCAIAVQCLPGIKEAMINLDFIKTIRLIAEANFIAGIANESYFGEKAKSIHASRIAKKGHAKHIASREKAIQYYKGNYKNFKNKEDAAEYISNHIVEAAYSTVRGYLRGVRPE